MQLRNAARSLVWGAATALATWAPWAGAQPSRIERTPDFVQSVNAAIESGSKWLLERRRPGGGWQTFQGYPAAITALCYHTLRVCGVPRDDAAMTAAYRALRAEYVAARDAKELRTYTAALVMMAIEEHARGRPDDGPTRGRYARRGGEKGRLDEPDLAWMEELVAFMEGNQATNGGWRYGEHVDRYRARRRSDDYDHSNTQYALLGLKAASRSGVQVRPDVYRKALEHLLRAQQEDGPETLRVSFGGKGETHARRMDRARGWGYYDVNLDYGRRGRRADRGPDPTQPYGSMTAGSLGALVICRSELLGSPGYTSTLDEQAEAAIWDGIAWLGRNFTVESNPKYQGWHYYYLYALERAGMLAGVDWIGPNDWYGEGATLLVDAQQRDGSWIETNPVEISTCFALLFLKKGTLPVARGAVTPSVDEDPIHFGVAPSLGEKAFADFVDLVISRYARSSSEERRASYAADLAKVGPRIVEPLIRSMATGTEATRRAAHSLLKRTTELTLAYDPAAPAARRFDQMAEIEAWYMARADRLTYDKAKRRLVAD